MMRALIQVGFRAPGEVLRLAEVDPPPMSADEVLVRVRAASIHIGDVYGMRGLPKVMRPMFRSIRPKNGVAGTDMAGVVEAVGREVSNLQPGDEVFGTCNGAIAEYVLAQSDAVELRPDSVTLDHAAAIAVSAHTALQALRDHGKLHAGRKVLITGASGGVGTFAVQVAKSMDAEVTGVCSTQNVDMVRSIGADHVIDYTQQDYTKGEAKYDLILDNVGNHSLKETRRALTPNGVLLANGAPAPTERFGGLGRPLMSTLVSIFVQQQGRAFLAVENRQDLATLKELAEAGKIAPVIDRTYSLDEAVEAASHVAEGHNQGTSIVTIWTTRAGEQQVDPDTNRPLKGDNEPWKE
jgi:NADPH:quinone reductase-like Zn-dependent oxidoreductase